MEESAISIFRKLPETKSQVNKYLELIRQPVLDGDVNSLDFISQVTALELLCKQIRADHLIKDVVLEEAEKYGEKSFERGNSKFQVAEVGVKYDYSNCNSTKLDELNEQIKYLSAKKKKEETFLRGIDPDDDVFSSEGVKLNPPVKTSMTQVKITLK